MDSRPAPLAALAPLLRALNDLKRIRAAHAEGSVAADLFRSAWAELAAGGDPAGVALRTAGRAVAATRLGAIDAAVLRGHGLSDEEVADVTRTAVAEFGDAALPEPLRQPIRDALGAPGRRDAPAMIGDAPPLPGFVAALARQPRAGPTHPGRPRLILEPAETHADHCLLVAVNAVLVSPRFGGDVGTAFLAGLAHHLFNASLPDAGFDGDGVLERAGVRDRVVRAAFDAALRELEPYPALLARVRDALRTTKAVDPPNSRCFHAAEVIDRVLDMAWFDRVARFRLGTAVRELNIVHAAPERAFQRQVLEEAGIWHEWPAE